MILNRAQLIIELDKQNHEGKVFVEQINLAILGLFDQGRVVASLDDDGKIVLSQPEKLN